MSAPPATAANLSHLEATPAPHAVKRWRWINAVERQWPRKRRDAHTGNWWPSPPPGYFRPALRLAGWYLECELNNGQRVFYRRNRPRDPANQS